MRTETNVVTGETTEELDAPLLPLGVLKDDRKAQISAQADGLIDAQAGNSPRQQLMMVARATAMIDKQLARGSPQPRDPQLDTLATIFDYIEAVNTNEQTAYDEVDAAADATEIAAVTLIAPPLPGA